MRLLASPQLSNYMAVETHLFGTTAQVIAGINALQPSNFPGQPAQLQRVQAAVIAEINSFANRTKFSVYMTCHHDNTISTINIRVYPTTLSANNDVSGMSATLNDTEQ